MHQIQSIYFNLRLSDRFLEYKQISVFKLSGFVVVLICIHVVNYFLCVSCILKKIKVCLWNTDYAPGGNKVQKSYF